MDSKNCVTENRALALGLIFITIVVGIFNTMLCVIIYAQEIKIDNLEDKLNHQEIVNNYTYNFYLSERIPIKDQTNKYIYSLQGLQEQNKKIQKELKKLNEEPKTEQLENIKTECVSTEVEQKEKVIQNEKVTINEEPLEEKLQVNEKDEVKEEKELVDQDKLELLAQLMYAEEGTLYHRYYDDEPEKVEKVFKLAGSVPIHRVEISLYGANSLEDVIFSTAYDQQTIDKVQNKQNVPDIVYDWAEELLVEGPEGPKGLIYQSEFHQGDETYYEAYNQVFCVETKYN